MTPEQINQFAKVIGAIYDGEADPDTSPNNYNRALDAVQAIKPLIDAAIAAERERAAGIADESADDLLSRMSDPGGIEPIDGDQVVIGYRMIGRLIRNPAIRARAKP